jgi:hypothetical protein
LFGQSVVEECRRIVDATARAAPKYLQDFRADEARILAHADRNTSTSRA